MSTIKTNILLKLSLLALAAAMTVSMALIISPVLSAQADNEVETTETLEVETVDAQDVDLTESDVAGDLEAETTQEEADEPSQVTYRFIAKECDSLTKLVRRAILVYDQANDDIELTPEGIIYAETNIVQKMGAYWLDIGDEVIVSGADVEMFAKSSLELTEAQVAAWSRYVPLVDFEIETIQQPEDVEEVVEEIQDELNDDDEKEDEVVDEEDDNGASAIWWVAGIGSVAAVWYLLWRREEE